MQTLETLSYLLPYILITTLIWITYGYTLRCGFVSDDIQGIAEYDGKLQGFEYGMLWRWVRYHICGGNFPSNKASQDGKFIPQGKIASRHHALSIIIFNITCISGYIALAQIVSPVISLLAILIFIVHPCSTQGVAWISGLAYPLSLLWMSVSLILVHWFQLHMTLTNAIWVIPTFCLIQWLSIHAIFATTAMFWGVLLFLGYWQFALLSFVISGVMCFDEIRKIVTLRVSEFKKQHMENSTVFHPRKFIVAMKTLCYYIFHAIAPIRMGLYHTWGFHYEKSIERTDKMFWIGFSFFCLLLCVFFKSDCISIKLGILWFLIFSTGFWNWITAQQFVTERYIMVANLGLGLVIATLTLNYPWIYFLILGLYLCRTWAHLPAYDNELRFYQSNAWNFPKSEVAMGNLGVTYARMGLEDMAKDTWRIGTQINPDYDVPWINIFYQFRTKAALLINNGEYILGLQKFKEGLPYLEKAMSCKVCHFPEQWKKEHSDLLNMLSNPALILQDELARLLKLKEDLRNRLSRTNNPQEIQGISSSLSDNEAHMEKLVNFFTMNKLTATNPSIFSHYHMTKSLEKLIRR